MSGFDPDAYLAEKEMIGAQPKSASFDPDKYLSEKGAPQAQDEPGLISKALEAYQSYLPAPARAGAVALAEGKNPVSAWWEQVGKPSETAPSPEEMMGAYGVSRTPLNQLYPSTKMNPADTGIPNTGFAGMVGGEDLNDMYAAQELLKHSPAEISGVPAGMVVDPANAVGPIAETGSAFLKGLRGLEKASEVAAPVAKTLAETSSVPGKISKAGESLSGIAENTALHSAGAQKTQFNKLSKRYQDRPQEVGRFIIDEKLAPPGASGKTVLENAQAVEDQAGDAIGKIYERLAKTGAGGTFNRKQLVDEIRAALNEDPGLSGLTLLDKKNALAKMDAQLAEFEAQSGPATFKELHNFKRGLDRRIYNDAGVAGSGIDNEAFSVIRSKLSNAINDRAVALSNKVRGQLGEELKAANKRYGMASDVVRVAQNKAAQEGNKFFSLTDTIAGSAAAGGGFAHGDPKALLYGVGGALASKAARKYGPGLSSMSADAAGKLLSKIGEASGKIPAAGPRTALQALRAASLEQELQNESKRPKMSKKSARLKAMGE